MGGIVSKGERRGSSEDEGTGSIRRVHPADRVTVDAFRPIVSLGPSHLGPVCLAERKSDARFFTIRHTLKYIALRDDLMDSILNEMQIWLCLDHPFIAKIRYTFQNDYYLYLVQDYMEGGNMLSLSMERKWSEPELVPIISEVVSAILYLHRMGVVHRDVRPKNIHLDSQGHACLTEFSLAVEMPKDKPLKSIVGCDGYMAPEIFARNGYVESVDFWSLGVTCYELLFREKPYKIQLKDNKKMGDVIFPEWIKCSLDYQSLTSGLLKVDPNQRLGGKGEGIKNLIEHPLFQYLNWEIVEMKMQRPTFTPKKSKNLYNEMTGVPEIGNGLSYITNLESKKYLFKEFEYFECAQKYATYNNPENTEETIYPNIVLGNDTSSDHSDNPGVNELPSFNIQRATRRGSSSPSSSIRALKSSRSSMISQQADSVMGYHKSSNSMIDSIGGASFASNVYTRLTKDRTREGSFVSASFHHKSGRETKSRDPSYNNQKSKESSISQIAHIKEEAGDSDRPSMNQVPQTLAKRYTAFKVLTKASSPLVSQEIRVPFDERDGLNSLSIEPRSLDMQSSPVGSMSSSLTSPSVKPPTSNFSEVNLHPRRSEVKFIPETLPIGENVYSSDPNINEEAKKVSFARRELSQKRRLDSSVL